ncbi:winged helix-turn-helix domain-containing protein [Sphingobium nicotianae]|uniref:Winged helix-turn-helix domain-containing protein n=1 Tax=Sphingobium nicotianae TaxID=2782607 RepID=A0A9X1IR62_9SPHN|nr:winged helix-turn-helix domain-containing protein [Sphingobium nicotianae]MBT2187094.1 winged helix-turn-helix domain-containing protein [Sphingobium nicotianae]
MQPAQTQILAFGDFLLDVRRRRLTDRATGVPSTLSGRPLDTLIYLAVRSGVLVSKEELMAAIWRGVTVEDNSLAKCISAIRNALGENPSDNRFIVTEARRGYRFVAEIKTLEPVEPSLSSRRLSASPQASQLFVSGWSALTRPGGATLWRGLDHLQQAVQIDPQFALAHACVAGGYALLGVFGLAAPRDVFPKAHAAAIAAIEADATLADGHAQLGHVYTMFEFDFAAADGCYRRALDLNPDCLVALHYRALQAICAGRFEDALRDLRRAQAIEPLAANVSANIAMAYYYAGEYDQAIAQAEATLELAPQFAHAQSLLGRSWLRLGDVDRALELFHLRSGETIGSAADLPAALALAGRHVESRLCLDELRAARDRRYVSAFDIATIYAAHNATNDALDWLEIALAERAQPISALAVDPAFKHLGEEPRFRDMLGKLGHTHSGQTSRRA